MMDSRPPTSPASCTVIRAAKVLAPQSIRLQPQRRCTIGSCPPRYPEGAAWWLCVSCWSRPRLASWGTRVVQWYAVWSRSRGEDAGLCICCPCVLQA